MSSEPSDRIFKIVLAGDSGVGKTAVLHRLLTGTFCDREKPTIGIECRRYACNVAGERITLQVWDTAGQERFQSVTTAYFRTAVGAILMFDLTSKGSFEHLETWIQRAKTDCAANARIALVANKVDMDDERVTSKTEAQVLANKYDVPYFETSARNGCGVSEAFGSLAEDIVNALNEGCLVIPNPSASTLASRSEDPQGGGCC
jgi:small GTP-binding protein